MTKFNENFIIKINSKCITKINKILFLNLALKRLQKMLPLAQLICQVKLKKNSKKIYAQ